MVRLASFDYLCYFDVLLNEVIKSITFQIQQLFELVLKSQKLQHGSVNTDDTTASLSTRDRHQAKIL
jgi:hypothetical protein